VPPPDQPTHADGLPDSDLPGPNTLAQTGVDGTPLSPTTSRPVSPTAGRYHIIRPHAHGGLGEVFLARDEELGRDVALKRLRPKRADDPASRRRFVAEAAVTARLEHPGIVPVHGLVNDSDGRPCYAMRFIQGDTLADAIARFHAALQFDSLDFRQLLTRFVAVCNAIAYAHSRGVIHRDLKPANVMLGPFGETLVVDWGLAKDIGCVDEPLSGDPKASLTDSETQVGEVIGTPAYMSPEQAEGRQAGPAADVYGLGAVLYTLLTGKLPITGLVAQVALYRVSKGDIPPPRAVQSTVPRPLDSVCRKAMALTPADRYASPLALAADVERWLADEPVSADREPWRDRVRRWVKRHRPAVAAAAALLVAAVVGLAVTTVIVGRQQAETAAAKRRVEEQRDRADQNLDLARQAVDTAVNRVSANPRLRAGDFHELRAELLTSLIPFYEKLAQQAGDDPTAEAQRGFAYRRLGGLRYELNQMAEAERAFRQMVEVFTALVASHTDEPVYRAELAQAHSNLGNVLSEIGRLAEARTELLEAVKLNRQLADNAAGRLVLAAGLSNLAILYQSSGESAAAETAFREALALDAEVATDRPDDRIPVARCADVEDNLAVLLKTLNRATEAEPLYRSAIARRERLTAANPADEEARHNLAKGRYNLANLLNMVGRHAEADAEYRTALGGYEKLAADFASVPGYRQELAKGLSNLAVTRAIAGKTAEAAELLHRAAGLLDRLVSDYPATTEYRKAAADCWFNLGRALEIVGPPGDAEAAYRRAADEYARLATDNPSNPRAVADLAATWVAIGDFMRATARPAEAIAWYDRAIARVTGGDALRDVHTGRAEALTTLERFAEALAAWEAALKLTDTDRMAALRLRRARTAVLAGDHRRAADEARAVASAGKPTADTLDSAARILARAAAIPGPMADAYADEAIGLLRRGRAAGRYLGPKAADELRTDVDFAALRERPGFQKFLTEIGR
jgi:tetratricopeptide (TPR) repeat protein